MIEPSGVFGAGVLFEIEGVAVGAREGYLGSVFAPARLCTGNRCALAAIIDQLIAERVLPQSTANVISERAGNA